MSEDRKKQSWVPMWHGGLALALMAGSLLFWWFQFWTDELVIVSDSAAAAPLQVIDIASAEQSDWWERAHVWLPTRFALPEPGGFSGVIHDRGIAVLPPVDQPPAMTMKLEERLTDPPESPLLISSVPGQTARRVTHLLPPERAPSRTTQLAPERARDADPVIAALQSPPAREQQRADWPPQPSEDWGADPWSLTGILYVNSEGVVTHVVIDMEPVIPRVSEQVRNQLLQWRWEPAPNESVVRVGISYAGLEHRAGEDGDG